MYFIISFQAHIGQTEPRSDPQNPVEQVCATHSSLLQAPSQPGENVNEGGKWKLMLQNTGKER